MIAAALRRRSESRATLANPDQWLISAFGGATTNADVSVTPDSALTNTAVLASIQRLARTIASLPLIVYRRLEGGGKERDRAHPNAALLHDQANEEMTAVEFREFQMVSLLRYGNSYSAIDVGASGQRELWPLRSDRVKVERKGGRLLYRWTPASAPERVFLQRDIHHIRGLSIDGITGLSPIDLARESIGLGLAAEEFGARFFANDASSGGFLSHPGELSLPAQKRLLESFEAGRTGLSKAHKTAVLEEGMGYTQTSVDPRDSQLDELRKFQVREAARIFSIQPHLIADLDNATFTNIESQGIEFVVYTLGYWLRSFESAIQRDLFMPRELETHFAEFLVDGLLRGDVQARGEFYMKMFQMGAMSPNEIRGKENMNPREGGDELYVPLNMVPVRLAGQFGAVGSTTRALPSDRETRANGGGLVRRALRPAFAALFAEATAKIIRSERLEVMAEAERQLARRDVPQLLTWMEGFYRDHEPFIQAQLAPVYRAQAEAVEPGASEEIGAESIQGEDFDVFVSELTAAHVARHIRSSKGQIRKVIEERPQDPLEALGERFDDWEEKRAEQVASRVSVQTGEAVAKFVYAAAGFSLVWRTFGKNCPMCDAMNGRVISRGGAFLADGETFSVDGVPPLRVTSNISHPPLHAGCLPGHLHVAAEGISASSERWYDGDLVILHTTSGHQLSCTPNHPILTEAGWVAAGLLYKGGHVISSRTIERNSAIVGHHQNVPAQIEDVAKALGGSREVVSTEMEGASVDFHGDGRDREVTVIRTHSELLRKHEAAIRQQLSKGALRVRDAKASNLSRERHGRPLLESVSSSGGCQMCGRDLMAPLFGAHLLPQQPNSFSGAPGSDAGFEQVSTDNAPRYTQLLREREFGFAGDVFRDEILGVERKPFHGYVFNLHTERHFYVAEGIITHNCDCSVGPG